MILYLSYDINKLTIESLTMMFNLPKAIKKVNS